MDEFLILAEAFRYPEPGMIERLRAGLVELPPGGIRTSLSAFIEQVSQLSLGAWEELYTRTLDINPQATPYIGFQIWGNSYQRGSFMARLNHEMLTHGVDMSGELPDHLIPVLRYLSTAPGPFPELTEALGPALVSMQRTLKKADAENPYLRLLEAVELACSTLPQQI